MKKTSLFLIVLLSLINCYSQEPVKIKHKSFSSFMTTQTSNIEELNVGLSSANVKEIMGTSFILNIPETGEMKELNQLLKQPEFVNKYKSNPKLLVDVLWYFSTPKDQNGFISKSECTPVIFENDSLVGKGWPFFQTYRRTGKMR